MPEQGAVAGLLLAAVLASSAGMGWLALSMQVHARQAWDATPSSATMRALRWMGVAGIVIALVLCLRADHASMAVLVWLMSLTGAALLTALLLASRPRWLRLLAPWVRARAASAQSQASSNADI